MRTQYAQELIPPTAAKPALRLTKPPAGKDRLPATGLGLLVLSALIAPVVSTAAPVPGIITYQGRITSNGTNYTGLGQFKFALVGPALGLGHIAATLWSQDGKDVPVSVVSVPVTNGLFTVGLGDTAIEGMERVIPAAVFDNASVSLRIWFNDGGRSFVQLAPDQRLTSVGYALRADNVVDGAISGAQLSPGFWNATNLPPNSVSSEQLANNIDLGSADAIGQLDVFRTAAGTPAISLFGSSSRISTYGSDGLEQIRLSGTAWGELLLNNSLANNATAVRLTAQGATGGQLELRNTNGSTRAVLEGENVGGTLTLYQADGNPGAILYGNEGQGSGALSLRNTTGSPRFRAYGGPTSGRLDLYDTDGTLTVNVDAAEGSEGAQVNLYQADGSRTVQLDAEAGANGGGYLGLYEGDGTELVTAAANGNGSVTVRQGDGSIGARLAADNGSGGGAANIYRDNGTFAGQLTVADSAGYLGLANSAGVNRFIGVGATAAGGAALYLLDSTGNASIVLDSDSNNEGRIFTQVLTITGGSDLSENFEINAAKSELRPGMLVCIDPNRPGELVLSRDPYDTTVAGVVSGAGGVKPGMLMSQVGTKADGKHPVALSGRVYCYVDADVGGAVRPGDLLTTSSTPGHAMKVTDRLQAQGAMIGKAMTSLKSGQGLVLVLVSLQ